MADRGTALALGYVLTLAIALVLVGGLFVAGGEFLEDERKQVVRQELEVIGQHLAANVEMADRLVQAGDDTSTVTLNRSFPERVTGTTYRVELVSGSDPTLRLNATDPEVSVEIEIDNTTSLRRSTATGGDVSVVYDPSTDELVIQNA